MPQRVRVLLTKWPTVGSVTASHARPKNVQMDTMYGEIWAGWTQRQGGEMSETLESGTFVSTVCPPTYPSNFEKKRREEEADDRVCRHAHKATCGHIGGQGLQEGRARVWG
jgi:hypothetical protein